MNSEMELERLGDFTYRLSDEMIQRVQISPIEKLIASFRNEGYEIRIVGGAVRDLLLNRVPKDFDLATTAKPDEVEKVCYQHQIKCVKTGFQHGTLTAVIDKVNYEVTTLRTDVATDGRHAVVEYINDWKLDAERRDLTINAMYISYEGVLYDYFNGLNDIRAKKIRFVNDPELRIREDHLRILRFFRLYGRISGDPATEENFQISVLKIIQKLAHNLKNISTERIWVEFSQILTIHCAPSIINIMQNYDVMTNIGFSHVTDSHLSRFALYHNCSVNRTECSAKVKPAALLSAFFDDEEAAEKVCRYLKLSNDSRAICLFIVKFRSQYPNGRRDIARYKQLIVESFTSGNPEKVIDRAIQLMLVEGASNADIKDIQDWKIPKFPVKGHDLKCYIKGPKIGQTLNAMKKTWIQSGFTSSLEDLIGPYTIETKQPD